MNKIYYIIGCFSLYFLISLPVFGQNGEYKVCKEYFFENNKNISEYRNFLEKIVEQEPQNVECLLKLANIYIQGDKVSRGFDLLRRAYEVNPGYVEKRQISKILDLALKLSRLKERAVRENTPILWNKLGDEYFDMGLFKEAAIAYKMSLRLDENQTLINIYMALSLDNLSKTYSAIEYLQKALKLDSENFYANYYMAKILKNEINDKKKAINFFRKAEKILKKTGIKGFESKEEYNYLLKDLAREVNEKRERE